MKNFYSGNTDHLDIVEVNENTPHKDKIIKIIDPTQTTPDQNKPLWFKNQEKSIILQAEKDQIDELTNKNITEKATFERKKLITINKLKTHNNNNNVKERTLNKKEKLVDKKAKNLADYFNNILESDLIKTFTDKIIARGKAKHIGPMELADTETKLIKKMNNDLLEHYKELNPKELKKHVEREKVKADELAIKIQNRHDTNEFKTQQEIDIEK